MSTVANAELENRKGENEAKSDECGENVAEKELNKIGDEECEVNASKNDIKCEICGIDKSEFWRLVGKNVAVCNKCFNDKQHLRLYNSNNRISSLDKASSETFSSSTGNLRSDRHLKSKNSAKISENDVGKLRRVPGEESVVHNGFHVKVNDIVSIVDETDKNTYYAQIRGLFVDEHLNNKAVITWLLPTDLSQNDSGAFNLDTYILGPDEDFARPLDSLQFVYRPKTNYFKMNYHLFDKNM